MKKRQIPRAAWISLGATLGAAALVVWAFRVWNNVEPVQPHFTQISDTLVTWRCDNGHLFESLGHADPRPCWQCGATAYPVITFICEIHGEVEVAYQFRRDQKGVLVPDKVRVGSGEWTDYEGGLICDRCKLPIVREEHDPLEPTNSNRRRRQPAPRP